MTVSKNIITHSFPLSKRALRLQPPPINWLIQYDLTHPEVISLAAGLVDYPSLPGRSLGECLKKVLKSPNLHKFLQYGTTQGHPELREEACKHFASLEKPLPGGYLPQPDQCVISNGSQQLLSILADILLDPGDIILVEAPTYFVFLGSLQGTGAEIVNVDADADGLIPASLEEVLANLESEGRLSKVKGLYVVDYYQNPTGRSLAEERKPLIVDLVKKFSESQPILIIEDSAYRPLSFETDLKNSLKSYDSENQWVAYTATFSKSYSPGLKLGYGLMPEPVKQAVINEKGNQDFGTANFNQAVMLEILKSEIYKNHVTNLVKRYRRKAEVMHQALTEHMPGEVDFVMPMGGMYFWLTFPESIPTTRNSLLFDNCLKNDVLYVPGEYCYHQPDVERPLGRHEMRLAYGTVAMEEIEEGIRRLARSLQD